MGRLIPWNGRSVDGEPIVQDWPIERTAIEGYEALVRFHFPCDEMEQSRLVFGCRHKILTHAEF